MSAFTEFFDAHPELFPYLMVHLTAPGYVFEGDPLNVMERDGLALGSYQINGLRPGDFEALCAQHGEDATNISLQALGYDRYATSEGEEKAGAVLYALVNTQVVSIDDARALITKKNSSVHQQEEERLAAEKDGK
jgi:hypothetical protein